MKLHPLVEIGRRRLLVARRLESDKHFILKLAIITRPPDGVLLAARRLRRLASLLEL